MNLYELQHVGYQHRGAGTLQKCVQCHIPVNSSVMDRGERAGEQLPCFTVLVRVLYCPKCVLVVSDQAPRYTAAGEAPRYEDHAAQFNYRLCVNISDLLRSRTADTSLHCIRRLVENVSKRAFRG